MEHAVVAGKERKANVGAETKRLPLNTYLKNI